MKPPLLPVAPVLNTRSKGFRDVLRMFLGISLLPYGVSKMLDMQFPQGVVFLDEAIQKLHGQSVQQLPGLSVFLLFFSFSRPYQIATGLIEILAAVLMFFRRTWPLGAILYLVVMVYVALVDLCYRVWLNGTLTACVLLAGILTLLILERGRFLRSLGVLLTDPAPLPGELPAGELPGERVLRQSGEELSVSSEEPAPVAITAPTATPMSARQKQTNRSWYSTQVFIIALVAFVVITPFIDWLADKITAYR